MKNAIIEASISGLQKEGLMFSIDAVSEKLKISKKTIYKYFPNKEALALAIYEKYYADIINRADDIVKSQDAPNRELLFLYFESIKMVRKEIFNKFNLNKVIYDFAVKKNNELWLKFSSLLPDGNDSETVRIIIDGTFEKLCNFQSMTEKTIERLIKIL